MDQKQAFKQMVEFNKGAFNNAFNAMVMVQDQNETLANTLLNQASWLPEEGKQAVKDWVAAFKRDARSIKRLWTRPSARWRHTYDRQNI